MSEQSLHDQIMNLPVEDADEMEAERRAPYLKGHRDARIAAAELAAAHEQHAERELESLREHVRVLTQMLQPRMAAAIARKMEDA